MFNNDNADSKIQQHTYRSISYFLYIIIVRERADVYPLLTLYNKQMTTAWIFKSNLGFKLTTKLINTIT